MAALPAESAGSRAWRVLTAKKDSSVSYTPVQEPRNLKPITSYFGGDSDDESLSRHPTHNLPGSLHNSVPLLTKPSIVSIAHTESTNGGYNGGISGIVGDNSVNVDPGKNNTINQFWKSLYLDQSEITQEMSVGPLGISDIPESSQTGQAQVLALMPAGEESHSYEGSVTPKDQSVILRDFKVDASYKPIVNLNEECNTANSTFTRNRGSVLQLPQSPIVKMIENEESFDQNNLDHADDKNPRESVSYSICSTTKSSVTGPRPPPADWNILSAKMHADLERVEEVEIVEKTATMKEAFKRAFFKATAALKFKPSDQSESRLLDIERQSAAVRDSSAVSPGSRPIPFQRPSVSSTIGPRPQPK